jgi:selenocysteine lyase/cysteine desulfurase
LRSSDPRPPYDIEAVRREIPILDRLVPMNACSQAPQTVRTRQAAESYLESWNRAGMDWDRWIDEVERARAAFARLIGATADDVAVTSSLSGAASAVATALDFAGERDTVLASGAEFPTVGHVWLAQERRGARVRWVPVRDGVLHLDDYERLLDERVAVVSACHAHYLTGFRQDVAAIARLAHDAGALVFVDAYQSLGTCPIDVHALGVDVLASGNLKFLMGIPGIAFLYVRPGVRERLEPLTTGWFGRANPFSFDATRLDWPPSARRFDAWTPPVLAAYVCRAGMELIEEVGPARIAAWTEVLSRRLIDGGRARGLELVGTDDPARKTPTTAFRCPGDSHLVEAALRSLGVIGAARGPVMRLAPHYYSTLADVERALDALATAMLASPARPGG